MHKIRLKLKKLLILALAVFNDHYFNQTFICPSTFKDKFIISSIFFFVLG